LYGDRPPPAFSWLQITGRAGKDDFGLSSSGYLIVSKRIVNLLKAFGLKYCEISEYEEFVVASASADHSAAVVAERRRGGAAGIVSGL
jgi:hypothetical protein